MAQLSVDSEELARLSQALGRAASQVDSALNAPVERYELLLSEWAGGASWTARSGLEEVRDAHRRLIDALASLSRFTESAADAYAEAEADIKRSLDL